MLATARRIRATCSPRTDNYATVRLRRCSVVDRNGVLRSSLWGKLVLYYQLGRLGRGYRVRVAMHYFPGAIFRPKDRRNPHGNRCDIIPALDLGLASLHLDCVGKLRSYVLCYVLKASGLAISVVRCGTL